MSTEATVNVVARRTLRRAHELASVEPLNSPVRLGPFDQLGPPFVPITVVYAYKRPGTSSTEVQDANSSELISIDRLARAMELLLDYYQHLSGRLQFNPSDGTPEIAHLDTGIQLLEARCSARLDDSVDASTGRIMMPGLPGSGTTLLPQFVPALEAVCRNPIFSIQHTRFACGSVTIGISIHHIVCDAEGFFQLTRDLAELYRGLGTAEVKVGSEAGAAVAALARPPHIRSYLSELCNMAPEERQSALNFQPSLFTLDPKRGGSTAGTEAVTAHVSSAAPPQPPVVGRVLRFSGSELAMLRKNATDPYRRGWVSTFDALSAHIFQHVYQARLRLRRSRGLPSSDTSDIPRGFLTSVNLRSSERLNLPPRYFPNAVVTTFKTLHHDVIANGPLWQVAKIIHDLTHSVAPKEVDQTLHWIAAQPDKRQIKPAILDGLGSFIVTQWCKFDMYAGADFDVDTLGIPIPPALVSPPFTQISLLDGLAFFLATEEQLLQRVATTDMKLPSARHNPSAIDVNLTISEPVWQFFDHSVA
ncbi:uncharacterized protein K452DRAFT_228766 [Aplosporella prunicola CBS 121167]|uniref:Transferase family protein n=1 Tax=Aplosporella prunicola CBS 121167 TaxID=1176127 RepID=A0A6A6BG57_9PEZI|nr:uncharacterized protein K452DRAFT_228766 [Aplosporella prunicola CBS 121167]KAF2141491.1 hypothetical protein K452DRAFT_228766 [Aplosporella prunicola CBS 121167]